MDKNEVNLIESQIADLWAHGWKQLGDRARALYLRAVAPFSHGTVENAINDLWAQKSDRLPTLEKFREAIQFKLPKREREAREEEQKWCYCPACMMGNDPRYEHMSKQERYQRYMDNRIRKARAQYGDEFAQPHIDKAEHEWRQRCMHDRGGGPDMTFRQHVDAAPDDCPIKRALRGDGRLSNVLKNIDDEAPAMSWKDRAQVIAEMAGGEA